MARDDNEISDEYLAELVEELSGARRRVRQDASHQIAQVALVSPERLYDHVDALVDALYRPEAQTRWEVLSALEQVARKRADLTSAACDGAEAALFDEMSSAVRLAAFRFLARYGSSAPERSDEVWDLMDEAIQCYHGDPEYRDMLSCLLDFAHGELSEATTEALVARIGFDAKYGVDYIKAFSSDIVKVIGKSGEETADEVEVHAEAQDETDAEVQMAQNALREAELDVDAEIEAEITAEVVDEAEAEAVAEVVDLTEEIAEDAGM